MYKKMLIPLDRSEVAEAVFPQAKEIAGRLGLELILLHVISQEENDKASNYKSYLDRAAELLINQSHYVQRSTGSVGRIAAVRVQNMLKVGNPAEEILSYTEQNNVDLILMATHGRSGMSRWALGSVADKVLRRANIPVWLVRAGISDLVVPDTWPKMTILVPLDGSELAESVLPHVETLVKLRGVEPEIVLIRVFEPPFITSAYPEATTELGWEQHVQQLTEHYRNEYERYSTDIIQRLSATGVNVQSAITMGDPATEIIEYANKNPVNLIVMATHGRSGVSRWAYGSVADKVLRRASRPLFLVRVSQAHW